MANPERQFVHDVAVVHAVQLVGQAIREKLGIKKGEKFCNWCKLHC